MIAKVVGAGRSFSGVAMYCLRDAAEAGARRPKTRWRVEWAETRNLATGDPDRAWRLMAATARAAPELKRLAGGSAGGRKLEKPVYHYTLAWRAGERPGRAEMARAVDESLEALGFGGREVLMVAHNDTEHRHVHVIVNRVDPETGKAGSLSKDYLRLSRWAEGWERERGEVQCPERVKANAARARGEWVRHGDGLPTGRHRREWMQESRLRRSEPSRDLDREAAVRRWRAAEGEEWRWVSKWREGKLERLSWRAASEWREVYGAQRRREAALERLVRTGAGRVRAARIAEGGEWGRLGVESGEREGALQRLKRGASETWRSASDIGWRRAWSAVVGGRGSSALDGWRADLERHHLVERAETGRRHHSEAVRVEAQAGAAYRESVREATSQAREVQREEEWRERSGRSLGPIRPPQVERDRGDGWFER